MTELFKKYSDKLDEQCLCERGAPLICTVDADVTWNREDPLRVSYAMPQAMSRTTL